MKLMSVLEFMDVIILTRYFLLLGRRSIASIATRSKNATPDYCSHDPISTVS